MPTMIEMAVLRRIAEYASKSEFACRVTVEEMGVRINMWTREGDIYADRNYIIGWTELEHFDDAHISTTFEMLNSYIKRRLVAKMQERISQNGN